MSSKSIAMNRGLMGLALSTLAITPSGAFSPGPLSASAVATGANLGLAAGLVMAAGHMAFELPYVYALTSLYPRVSGFLERRGRALVAGASLFILFFAALLFVDAYRVATGAASLFQGGRQALNLAGAFVIGVVLTCCNPFFLLWWVSVGLPLVRESWRHGLPGFTVMYTLHVLLDYFWLGLLAGAAGLVAEAAWAYSSLLAAVGVFLVYMAVKMMREWEARGQGREGLSLPGGLAEFSHGKARCYY